MPEDLIDIKDLEAFINGLLTTIDTLENVSTADTPGVQAQLAKTISSLRLKKIAKIDSIPKHFKVMSKEELKSYLINQLEHFKYLLETEEVNSRKKFELVMKITKLRERIATL